MSYQRFCTTCYACRVHATNIRPSVHLQHWRWWIVDIVQQKVEVGTWQDKPVSWLPPTVIAHSLYAPMDTIFGGVGHSSVVFQRWNGRLDFHEICCQHRISHRTDHLIVFARWRQQQKNGRVTMGLLFILTGEACSWRAAWRALRRSLTGATGAGSDDDGPSTKSRRNATMKRRWSNWRWSCTAAASHSPIVVSTPRRTCCALAATSSVLRWGRSGNGVVDWGCCSTQAAVRRSITDIVLTAPVQ